MGAVTRRSPLTETRGGANTRSPSESATLRSLLKFVPSAMV